MSSETVNRKRRRKRRSRRRSRSRAWIAALAVVLVAAAGAGAWIYFRGLPPKAELYLALRQWTAQWRAGDGSALEEGLRFGAPRADAARAEADDLARTEEERREAMEPYAALLDEPAPEAEEDLLSVLLPQTEVAFSLPDRVEAGAAVTFVITGPDMAGDYPERTVTAQAPIEALESGYRLRNSYALIDGLYGGLPGIVAEALPAAQETGREEA